MTTAANNKVPPVSIKDEMHGIEIALKWLIQIFINTLPVDIVPPVEGFLTKDDFKPPTTEPLIDQRLKKIFVYAEDKFAPQSATERRTIDVRTPAFDLSGWIDLSELRAGDVVEITTWVRVAGQRRRFYRNRFDQPALLPFSDFARGLQYISGNDVRVQIRQPVSGDNFATPVQLGYQFVVESQ